MPHTLAAKVAFSVIGFNFVLYGVTADGLIDLLFSRIWMAMAVSLVAVPIAVVITYVFFYGVYKRMDGQNSASPKGWKKRGDEEFW